jgi:hypothetical protein
MNRARFVPVDKLPPPANGVRRNRFDAMVVQVAKEGHDVAWIPADSIVEARHQVTALKNAIRRTGLPFRVVQRQNRVYVARTDRGLPL